ncbi:3-hydroxyacyl-CoA dehydrogenase [Fructilactobacillus sp. Tb1]|uniref:3-hydroxyacyl-CoA dehydrogenase n=1 Tax=Fructilactobacillus sp. Tb1 TaxID=3422304 RepID=UPI003D298C10
MEFNKITIIGGGTLGSQIAYMCSLHGKDTTIYGRSEGSLERAQKRVARWVKAVEKDIHVPAAEAEKAAKNLKYTTNLDEAIKGQDLVIEALPEDPKIKIEFYKKFAKIADPDTILATNTSTLLPSTFAEDTGRPDKYIAYHFANNIWINNTAEIMPQAKTNPALTAAFEKLSREIGMVPIKINKEQPGYVLNSLLIPFLTAALKLWADGVSEPAAIDKTWIIATSAPVGPFSIMDTIGLRTMYEITSMDKDPLVQKAAKMLKEKLDKGELGTESGQGFYSYPNPAFLDKDFLK